MTDAQEPAPPDKARARQEYREQKRKTLQSLAGCLAGLGLCLGCCLLPGAITSAVTYLTTAPWQVSDPNVETILLIEMRELLAKFFWYSLLGIAIAGGIIGFVSAKVKVLTVPAVIVFGIVAPGLLVYLMGYRDFVAVRAGAGKVELRYLWPRPARELEASALTAVRAVETDKLTDGDGVDFLWLLEIESDHTVYSSQLTPLSPKVTDARNRVLREKYQTLLRSLEKTAEPDQSDVADVLNALARVFMSEKKDAEAEPLFWRALGIAEKSDGVDALRVAASTYGLARIYHGRKQFDKAQPLYERTMAIQAKHLDQQHPDCWDAFWSYQALLRDTGQSPGAETMPRPAYTLFDHLRRVHGKEGAERLIKEMIEKRRRDRER